MRIASSLSVVAALLTSYLIGCDSGTSRAPDSRSDRSGVDGPRTDDLARADSRGGEASRTDRATGTDKPGSADKPAAADSKPAQVAGTIVPLYAYPTNASWTQIVQARQANPSVPVIAIVNVSDGPGSAVESTFASSIPKLTAAGIVVIGYVYTSYGTRQQALVKTDIDRWKSFYPQVTGVFFDEQSDSTGMISYYSSVGGYAKSAGFTLTVGNPGADIPQSYLGVLDTYFIYESDGLPTLASLGGWHAGVDRKSFGIIPYAVPTLDASFVQSAKQTIGYIYITSDDLPNPWDSLPSYFSQLLGELAK
jgi:hypothetical protein